LSEDLIVEAERHRRTWLVDLVNGCLDKMSPDEIAQIIANAKRLLE